MAKNQVGHGNRVRVTATADRTSGDFVLEDGFHGVCVNDIADTEVGVLDISQVEIQVNEVASVAKGSAIYITLAGALSLTATNHRLVGFCTATDAEDGVPSGKMWMLVAAQNATAPSA